MRRRCFERALARVESNSRNADLVFNLLVRHPNAVAVLYAVVGEVGIAAAVVVDFDVERERTCLLDYEVHIGVVCRVSLVPAVCPLVAFVIVVSPLAVAGVFVAAEYLYAVALS